MKYFFPLIAFFFFTYRSTAQQDKIPPQYRVMEEALGDLDRDGIDEKVAVYNMSEEDDSEFEVKRELIIFRKLGENWIPWHRSTQAVGDSKSGGALVDPFEGIEIRDGVLLVYQRGGSNHKWSKTDKYRYQNNAFELIGYTITNGSNCDSWQTLDYNISTTKAVATKDYEKCEGEKENKVIKTEKETFFYKLKRTIRIQDRTEDDGIEIKSPKYKLEFYL